MAGRIPRRTVLTGLAALMSIGPARAQRSAKVVVVGGGFGGATAARTLKQIAPALDVTLVEPNTSYTACPFSNLVIAGLRTLDAQTFNYDKLSQSGVTIVQDRAADIDASARTVQLGSGGTLSFDRLILSPGVDIRWSELDGYDMAAADVMPHAWKAGAQTALLGQQLQAMPENGLVVMSVPAAPYRCPPGPYERASLIANYLKTHKPRTKLLILDAKDTFSKQPLFQKAWEAEYADVLEWRSATDDGRVGRVDAQSMTLHTDFDAIRADVANVIPPQKAGEIASRAGVADATGWCPVNALSFESTLQPGVHVIGDAAIAAPMPKSAFAANLHGKVCAIQVARLLSGLPAGPTILTNTCYSYVTPEAAVSITGVYSNADGTFASVPGAGGLSAMDAGPGEQAAEAAQAQDWFHATTLEAFG